MENANFPDPVALTALTHHDMIPNTLRSAVIHLTGGGGHATVATAIAGGTQTPIHLVLPHAIRLTFLHAVVVAVVANLVQQVIELDIIVLDQPIVAGIIAEVTQADRALAVGGHQLQLRVHRTDLPGPFPEVLLVNTVADLLLSVGRHPTIHWSPLSESPLIPNHQQEKC